MLLDQVHKRNAMKGKRSITQVETFLRKIVGLLNKVEIRILHLIQLGVYG
jgi:hypothetical protein